MSFSSSRRNLDFAFPAFAPGLPSVYERAGFDVNKHHYSQRNGSQSTFGSGSSQGRSRQGSVSSAAKSAAIRLAGQTSSGGTVPDTPSALSSVVCSANNSNATSGVPSGVPSDAGSEASNGLNFEQYANPPPGEGAETMHDEDQDRFNYNETPRVTSVGSAKSRPTSARPSPIGLASLSRRTPPQSPLDATFPSLSTRPPAPAWDTSLPESLQNMAPPRADSETSSGHGGSNKGSSGTEGIVITRSLSGETEASKLSDMDMSMVSSIHDSPDDAPEEDLDGPEFEAASLASSMDMPATQPLNFKSHAGNEPFATTDSSFSQDDSVNRGDSTATSNSSGSADLDLEFPSKPLNNNLLTPEQINRFSTTSSIYSESPEPRSSEFPPRPFLQHRELQHRNMQSPRTNVPSPRDEPIREFREPRRDLSQGRRPSAPQMGSEPHEAIRRQHTLPLQRKTTLRRKPTLPPAHRMQENTTNIERSAMSPASAKKKTLPNTNMPMGLGLGMSNVEFHSHEDSMPPEQHKPFVPPHRTLSGRATTTTGYAYSTPPLNVRKDESHTEDVDINNPKAKDAKEAKEDKVCRGCSEAITGKSIHSKDGNLSGRWHRECFKCSGCAGKLKSEVYVLDDTPYCRPCYHEANNSACRACGAGIEGSCLETRLHEDPDSSEGAAEQLIRYHPHCLRCVECQADLLSSYFEVDGGNYCAEHASGAAEVPENIKQRYTRFAMI